MRRSSLLLLALGCSEYDIKSDPTGGSASATSTPSTTPASCPLDPPDPYGVSSDADCAGEPVVGTFEPVTEWTWTTNPVNPGFEQVMSTPMVANLTDDDGNGIIDGNDIPEVVFTSFAGADYGSAGAITAISGNGGAMVWSVRDAAGYAPYASGGIAIADLEGDGVPEVVVASPSGLLCLRNGAFAWIAPVPSSPFAMPAIADIDGDGLAEVVYGPSVVNADGTVRWIGTAGTGGPYYASFAADLEGDGRLEIIAGNTVYEADGTVRWNDGGIDGTPAIADFDLDGAPEIVRVYASTVQLSDTDGTLLWTFPLTDGGGGPPTVADFDGDGYPEIGVASREFYRVIDTDGTQLWANVVQDFSSSVTGSSVFDFEGDGAAEVVYADEETLWVYDGATGAVELQSTTHSSGTLLEYPVVVDVDHDGVTEIVVASNDYAIAGSHGITVIGDLAGSWAPARPVWNQHAYHITHIGDDGKVPAVQVPNWSSWNSFRAGNSETAAGLAWPDYRVAGPDTCLVECGADVAYAWFPVENEGAANGGDVALTVSWVDGATQVPLGEFPVGVVPAGDMTWVGPIAVASGDFGPDGLVVHVGAPGTSDCDESDNAWVWSAFPCP